jgi:diguanylate cyclase (GGDEF)-like protein/PAS domain S-box-containing protein
MPNYRSLLLVQGEGANAESVRAALVKTTDAWTRVIWVKTCAEALECLAGDVASEATIVAIVVDLCLPDCQGLVAFERIFAAAPQIPILVLCAAEREEAAKQAVHEGAQDYLLKERLDDYLLPKALANMIDRAAISEALFAEKERAEVTLNSIGDAVMSCDIAGRITYLNAVAERLTGWTRTEATGLPLEDVFHVVNGTTNDVVANPMAAAISTNKTVLLEPNSILRRRDGVEAAIEDSAAPIHDRLGLVTGAVMVFHDVSATRALSLRVSHQAHHDSLTDLPNRVLLQDRLNRAMAMSQRHGKKLAVLFLDVDRFKNVNDSLGHDVGDGLLVLVAQRLLACVRSSDTVSRQGGDEFVILLPELTRGRDAAIRAEKILAVLGAPYDIDSHRVHVTASIGIVIYPDDGADSEMLLKNADFAMYHAKESGRSNFQFFRQEMNVRALERQSIEDGLRHAVEREELVLHYQPIIDMWSGELTGIEALIRWRHPHHGLLPPDHFMAIAEESRLIVPIGRWVLREACRQGKVWDSLGLPPVRIAINVSAVELRDMEFVEYVRRVLAENEFPPGRLEIEITETFLMQDSTSTAVVLRSLKQLGVRVALDDFGTGYSSLSHLKGFPIDTLKIDRAFVSDITTNAEDASIVRAVIALGKSLHIRVIAEGVESVEQLAKLKDCQCREGQGFHFGRPVASDEISRLFCKTVGDTRTFATGRSARVPLLDRPLVRKSPDGSARRN